MAEQKIPTTVGFTSRQVLAVRSEARRLDISESEVVRRIVDWWIDGASPRSAPFREIGAQAQKAG